MSSAELVQWLVAVAAVGAALAAIYSARLNFIGQRQNIERQSTLFISGSRQAWINELRADVAEYISIADHMLSIYDRAVSAVSNAQAGNEPATYPSYGHAVLEKMREFGLLDQEMKFEAALARIVMRINPGNIADQLVETSARSLKKHLLDSVEQAVPSTMDLVVEFRRLREDLIAATRSVLKHEWEKIKQETTSG